MREVLIHDVPIDACDCGGLWFDRGEVERWASSIGPVGPFRDGAPARRLPDQPARRCPRSPRESLAAYTLGTSAFALCSECKGVWLPASTIAAINPAFGEASRSSGVSVLFELLFAVMGSL